MTDADDIKLELILAMQAINSAISLIPALQNQVNTAKNNVYIASLQSNREEPERIAERLSRTLLELGAIKSRLETLGPKLSEWIGSL